MDLGNPICWEDKDLPISSLKEHQHRWKEEQELKRQSKGLSFLFENLQHLKCAFNFHRSGGAHIHVCQRLISRVEKVGDGLINLNHIELWLRLEGSGGPLLFLFSCVILLVKK